MTRATREAAGLLVSVTLASVSILGCSSADSDTTAPTTASSGADSTPQTTRRSEKAAVEAAYLESWQVYAKAVRDLDASRLDSVYAGEALETVRREVERRRREQTPVHVDIDHRLDVQVLPSGTDALVRDTYVTRSVRLDPRTGEPAEEISPETVRETYQMRLLGDRWKVTAIVRTNA